MFKRIQDLKLAKIKVPVERSWKPGVSQIKNDDPPFYHHLNRFFRVSPISKLTEEHFSEKLSRGQDVIIYNLTARQNFTSIKLFNMIHTIFQFINTNCLNKTYLFQHT
ncbi:hypothetical protein RF11_12830 [Thelohanellus kitauei]|uniref:Uncharacterized protein n=1 Tax=Thelohanellus kitauei TaxID=669202 RepID=A0A0C2M2V6_THEKT|nr:hypothetical protein RF11_12830 [Thelohanellus kitauei]